MAFLADPLYSWYTAGTFRYCAGLVKAVASVPDVALTLVTTLRREAVAQISQARHVPPARSLPGLSSGTRRHLLWSLAVGPRTLDENAEVVHCPWMATAPHARQPLVVTVHDLSILTHPQHHTWRTRVMSAIGLREVRQQATLCIADSRATADDLIRLAGVSSSRIVVVPLAAEPVFERRVDAARVAQLGLDREYVLFVGTLEPRKNIEGLLDAFEALPSPRPRLALAGRLGWISPRLRRRLHALEAGGEVRHLPGLPDEDLAVLMSCAEVFVYPSHYEGFGLPVLEAMQCGAPVVTSRVSSLPEVTGDAACLVDPSDGGALGRALSRLLADEGLRRELAARGLERARSFTWAKSAALTVDAYGVAAARRSV